MSSRLAVIMVAIAVTSLLAGNPAAAQSFGDRLLQKAKQQVERRIETVAEQAVEQSLDVTEGAMRCRSSDSECIRGAQERGQTIVYTDDSDNPVEPPGPGASSGSDGAATAGGPAAARVGEGAWANYDFVPGDRVLVAEDFSTDRVGNFPRRLEFVEGNLEIVEWQGARFLSSTAESGFNVRLPETLPERFTIEFDLHTQIFLGEAHVLTEPQRNSYEANAAIYGGPMLVFGRRSGISVPEALTSTPQLVESLVPVRIMADGDYVKVFLNERRVANVPNAKFPRTNGVQIWLKGTEDKATLLGNLRIAAGGRELYDALQTDGKVTTQGILFDTGSDRIRPESTPTLKEIADMLTRYGDLRLRIEGHTDNVGDPSTNQQLSERRAEAVRQYLVTSEGVDAMRLTAVGKGQTEPAADNDSPEGRQNNRRVVLVKI
jgi:OmpA-OmpF porin, OOP family